MKVRYIVAGVFASMTLFMLCAWLIYGLESTDFRTVVIGAVLPIFAGSFFTVFVLYPRKMFQVMTDASNKALDWLIEHW